MRHCNCNNALKGNYDKTQCRLCWLALNDKRYQKLWKINELENTDVKIIKKQCGCTKIVVL